MAENKEEFVENVSKSVEDFTIDLYKMAAGRNKENLVCSALSAHVVLAMAAYGAKNKTAEEMKKVLHVPVNDDEAHQGFQYLMDELNNCSNIILKLANKILVTDTIIVNDEFKKLIKTHFHCESEALGFTNAIESAKTVNNWCDDSTNGKIQEILCSEDITPDLSMILLNAVYFKANWKYPFNKARTKILPFHVDENTVIQIPTMYIKEYFLYKYSKELNAHCVKLPYENDDVVLELIVPLEIDGLKHIEKYLENINDDEDVKYFEEEVEIFLPRFRMESTFDLNSYLQEMGMKDMFTSSANFEGISSEPLKIDKVLQRAFFEVDEVGSEGAACTQGFTFDCLPPDVRADKPFFFRIIVKNYTIFTGHVINPAEGLPIVAQTPTKRKIIEKMKKCSIS